MHPAMTVGPCMILDEVAFLSQCNARGIRPTFPVENERHSTGLFFSFVYSVFVIHRTLTWTIRSLTGVHDHSFACVYTRGLGTPTTSQHNMFDSENNSVLVLSTGFEPLVFGSRVDARPNWATRSFLPLDGTSASWTIACWGSQLVSWVFVSRTYCLSDFNNITFTCV